MRSSRWITVIAGVAFALVVGNTIVSTYNLYDLIENDRTLTETREVKYKLANLMSDLKDAETGCRGYYLTHEDTYLEPFDKSLPAIASDLEDLRIRLKDQPDQILRLDLLEVQIQERLGLLKDSIEMVQQDIPFEEIRRRLGPGVGKILMDSIRHEVMQMDKAQDRLIEVKGEISQTKFQSAIIAGILAGVLTIWLVVAAFILIRKELKRRYQAEQELQQIAADLETAQRHTRDSLTLLDSFLRNAPVGLAFQDTSGRFVKVNQQIAEINGRSIDDHLGHRLDEFLPDLDQRLKPFFQQVNQQGEPVLNQRLRLATSGRGEQVYLSSFYPIQGVDGRRLGIGMMLQNVTEQLQAEERLRESEVHFRSLADSIPQLCWMARPDGFIFWYNRRWYDFTGSTPEQMEGWGWQKVLLEKDSLRVVSKYKQAMNAGTIWEDTFEIRRGDGTMVSHLGRANPIRNESGEIILWFGTNTDISDRLEMETILRESRDRFRLLVEALPQLVWTCDTDGHPTQFNRRWIDYTGLDESSGRNWKQAIHPEELDTYRAEWRHALHTTPERFTYEYRLRSHDGHYRWMLTTAVPLRDETRKVIQWIVTLTDIEDQKHQEDVLMALVKMRTAELEASNRLLRDEVGERSRAEERVHLSAIELRRSNEELEKFAYVASHDLQEPLRKIQSFGDRLTTKYQQKLGTEGSDYIERMRASATRMRTLIDDLLMFSRVTTNSQPFAPVNLQNIVEEVIGDLEVRINQTEGEVKIESLPTLLANPVQMRQLFQNLLGNALKFQKPGVRPEICIFSQTLDSLPEEVDPLPPSRKGYRIVVQDNGIGFNQVYSERIFEVFQRLHGRNEYEGTGIGLAICRKIIQRHGGSITARSREGDGTSFILDFPA
jgi:PAS domain S-box-containing protein